jgi:DNA-binding transcriptional ArsR family regulator
MTVEEKIKFESMAKISKALAHPTRLFIIHKLEEEEYCVNELTKMIGSDISTVSKHLKILREAGIIIDEKRGNCVYYNLQTRCVLNIFNCVMNVIDSNKARMNLI